LLDSKEFGNPFLFEMINPKIKGNKEKVTRNFDCLILKKKGLEQSERQRISF
jgi:hypothetical protein